jgi:6-phosphofructokinase 2
MIVTVTLNPAIDKSTEVDRLVPEKKMRCPSLTIEAGGGGINVSKAIKELGGESVAIFPYGGLNGEVLLQLLSQKSIPTKGIKVDEDTRENFVVNETSTNRQYRFVMPGLTIDREDLLKIKDQILSINDATFLVFSGSMPVGLPESLIMERIAEFAIEKGMKLIVDTSGEPLKIALDKGVHLLKPNLAELCALVGKESLELSEIDKAAEQVMSSGKCEAIVVSMGPAGAMLFTNKTKRKFTAPVVKKLTTVGAGDSMVAGMTWMLEQKKSIEEAVQFGIACGTAATINKGTQLFKKEDAFRLYEWMKKNN